MPRSLPLIVVVLLLAACAGGSSTIAGERAGSQVLFGPDGASGSLSVDVADSDGERAQGLMGVEDLPPDDGMAFVWEEPTTGSFWMRDTLIPLSVAFVDAGGTIVTIRHMTPCEADPCATYAATEPYVFAVEANRGWFEAHDIGIGDPATLHVATDP